MSRTQPVLRILRQRRYQRVSYLREESIPRNIKRENSNRPLGPTQPVAVHGLHQRGHGLNACH
jgi:hypothetical protein